MATVNGIVLRSTFPCPSFLITRKSAFFSKTVEFGRFYSHRSRIYRFCRFVDSHARRRSFARRRNCFIIGKNLEGGKQKQKEEEEEEEEKQQEEEETGKGGKEKRKQERYEEDEKEKEKKIGKNPIYGDKPEVSSFREEKTKESKELTFFRVPQLGFLNVGFLKKEVEEEGEVEDKSGVNSNLGRMLLLGVAILWGLNGVIVKYIYSQQGPPQPIIIVFLRKVLSVAFFLSLLIWQRPSEAETDKRVRKVVGDQEGVGEGGGEGERAGVREGEREGEGEGDRWYTNPAVWLAGGEIGLWTFSGAICQTLGLEYTSATRGGFELQVKSILVPIMASFSGAEISGTTWTAAFLALCGIIILGISTLPKTSETLDDVTNFHDVSSFSADVANVSTICTEQICPSEPPFEFLGDIGVLAAAFFFALTTFRLGTHARKFPVIQLATTNMTVALILSAAFLAVDLDFVISNGGALESVWGSWRESNVVFAVAFSGLICGGVATLMQTTGQKVVAPPEAQVLYSLQPVWAALFASILLGEKVTPLGYFGGGVVLFATLLTTKNEKK